MPVSIASAQDIPFLVALINSAYRGEASKKGWTTEADLLQGELRTDMDSLTDILKNKNAIDEICFRKQSHYRVCISA